MTERDVADLCTKSSKMIEDKDKTWYIDVADLCTKSSKMIEDKD